MPSTGPDKRVRDEFVRNFEERGEVGASVSVRLFGWPVVDLWGGTANAETGQPWENPILETFESRLRGFVRAFFRGLRRDRDGQ